MTDTPTMQKARAMEALRNGDLILAPSHTHKCGSSHAASCSCGAVEKMAPLIKQIYDLLTPPECEDGGGCPSYFRDGEAHAWHQGYMARVAKERQEKAQSTPTESAGVVEALQKLIDDLEDRARWMEFKPAEDGKTVPCGYGVYVRAKQAIQAYNKERGEGE